MKTLFDVVEGDEVVLLRRNADVFRPYALATVKNVTAKYIDLGLHKFTKDGSPANQHSQGYRISVDSADLQSLKEKAEKVQESRDAQERAIKERDSRMTYQLACRIVNSADPAKSIEALERLGEERLRAIIEAIDKCSE